jgi:hypothetical protein
MKVLYLWSTHNDATNRSTQEACEAKQEQDNIEELKYNQNEYQDMPSNIDTLITIDEF